MSTDENAPEVGSDLHYREMYSRYKDEFLPELRQKHHQKEIARDRRRLATREVARQAIANALGTVVGGGILVLLGRLGGLLRDLSTTAILATALGVIVGLSLLIVLAWQRPRTPEEEASRLAAGVTMLQIEVDMHAEAARRRTSSR